MHTTPQNLERAQSLYAKLRQRQLAHTLSGQIALAVNYTNRINRIQSWALGALGLYTLS